MSKLEDRRKYEMAYIEYWSRFGEVRPEYDDYNIGCYEAAKIRVMVQKFYPNRSQA